MSSRNQLNQRDKIKADLLSGRRVDSVTAFSTHYITRLAAIIKHLRDKGWPITTDQEKGNGMARYSVPKDWRPDIKKPR